MLDKTALRRDLRARRRAFIDRLLATDLAAMHEELVSRLLPHLAGAKRVAAYIAAGGEIDPLAVVRKAADMGLATALPRIVSRDQPMAFHLWAPGDPLFTGLYELAQPAADAPPCEPDLILTPLLGFDRALGRIGQGAGFYDRAFLAHPHARRIGLAWSVQEVDALPLDPWDMPLHGVATEREWIGP